MSSSVEVNRIFRVDGLVAVITGGGTGIGLMMAKAFAANGASKVYVLGRRQEPLDEAAALRPGIIIPVQCDIGSKSSLQAAVDRITKETGHINLLIANSGTTGPINGYNPSLSISELRKRMFDEVNMDQFTNAFHVNVTGTFFTILAFLELLDAGNCKALEGGYGGPDAKEGKVPAVQSQVVVTGSISGFMRGKFSPPAYAGSKAAIMHLTKQAAGMLSPYGIRANALAPGLFLTDLAVPLTKGRVPEEEDFDNPMFIPARRWGGEEEMAGMALYLASRAGSYCNGLILNADGGRMSVTLASY